MERNEKDETGGEGDNMVENGVEGGFQCEWSVCVCVFCVLCIDEPTHGAAHKLSTQPHVDNAWFRWELVSI